MNFSFAATKHLMLHIGIEANGNLVNRALSVCVCVCGVLVSEYIAAHDIITAIIIISLIFIAEIDRPRREEWEKEIERKRIARANSARAQAHIHCVEHNELTERLFLLQSASSR